MRRDQAGGGAGPARGRRGHGLHRLRGGGLADPARRPGDRALPGPGSAGTGPGRPGRRGDRRHPPREGRRVATRRTGDGLRGHRTRGGRRDRGRSPYPVRFRRGGHRHNTRRPGRPRGRAAERDPDRRAVPGQRARRVRGRRCRQPPPPAVRAGPGRALQQRGEARRRRGQVHARLHGAVRLPLHVLVRSVRAQDRVRRPRRHVGPVRGPGQRGRPQADRLLPGRRGGAGRRRPRPRR